MTAASGQQAVQNGRQVHRYDQGYCQRYVRDPCWRVPSLYGSAIDAWNGAKHKHPGDRTPPEGAPCYYSGGQYGHAVISVGGGRIRSTDCTSATYVNDAALSWPETAWGYRYLGWTEDLNGVDLPLGGGGSGPPEPEVDEVAEFASVALNNLQVKPNDWRLLTWSNVKADTAKIAAEGHAGLDVGGRMYVATLHLHVVPNNPPDGPIRTRYVEGEFRGGDWHVTEEAGQQEHPMTGGPSMVVDTRAGKCPPDHRLRWQVQVPVGCVVDATCEVVTWKPT